jgi:hypothetical protein
LSCTPQLVPRDFGTREGLTDWNHPIGVVVSIVAEVVMWVFARSELAASRSIQDQQQTAHEPEDEYCASQDILCRISFDQWRNEDGSYTLKGLVQPGQNADSLECNGNVRPLLEFVVAIGCQRDDGAIESLQTKLI